jgi:hypothetical protein
MSLEKRFDIRVDSQEQTILFLRMNDGSELLGRYVSDVKVRKQDEFYFDGVIMHQGRRYNNEGRLGNPVTSQPSIRAYRIRVRDVKEVTPLSESVVSQTIEQVHRRAA